MWRFPLVNATTKPFNPAPRPPMRASAPQYLLHRAADLGRRLGDCDPGAAERLHLVRGGALAAGDDRAGMPQAAARRRRGAGDKADGGLFALGRFEECCAVLLG